MEADAPPTRQQFFRDRTFRSLQHSNYRRYFFGQLISFIGSWIQSTAIMWLAFDLTNDPRWPAYLIVAQIGPTILLGPLGGLIADRFPKRNVILLTQFAFMLNAVILTLLVATNSYSPAILLGVQLVGGLIQSFDLPTRLAVVSELVPKEDVVNAVGLNSLLFNSARAIGPGIAGMVYLSVKYLFETNATKIGSIVCFSLNTVSFAAVLFALRGMEVRAVGTSTRSSRNFLDGLRYLRKELSLGYLHFFTGLYCVFAWPILSMFPAYTRFVLGQAEESYSLLLSSFGVGALIGALTTATYGSVRRRVKFLLVGASCGLVGLGCLTATNALPFALAACSLIGFGMVLFLSTGQSTIQTCVPNELRGRVLAIWAIMLSTSALPGHLASGILASQYPIRHVLLGMTAGVAATTLGLGLFLVRRSLPKPLN
jgi:MFS family permease